MSAMSSATSALYSKYGPSRHLWPEYGSQQYNADTGGGTGGGMGWRTNPTGRGFGNSVGPSAGFTQGFGNRKYRGLGGIFGKFFGRSKGNQQNFRNPMQDMGNIGSTFAARPNTIMQMRQLPQNMGDMPQGMPSVGPGGGFAELIRNMKQRPLDGPPIGVQM